MSTKALTPKQAAILAYIQKNQPVTNSQIAARFNITSSTVTVYVMHLRRAGRIWSSGSKSGSRWNAIPTEAPPAARPLIEQVASVWQYAQRCGR